MGGKQSVEVPGGGSEGYHVLKARLLSPAIVVPSLAHWRCDSNVDT